MKFRAVRACVIGAGPAGLLAAYGAWQEGCRVTVIHPGDWSHIGGAQYLHGEIEGLEDDVDHFDIRYKWIGDEEVYRRKVYGELVEDGGTSWGKFKHKELAWDLRQAYDFLIKWASRKATIVREPVLPEDVPTLLKDFDYVFNTAPLFVLAPEGEYLMEKVYIISSNLEQVPANEIHYFGDGRPAHRGSNINGHGSTEFSASMVEKLSCGTRLKCKEFSKPLRCEGVELEGVYRLGRYGKWDKEQLVHQAYFEAREVVRRGLPWTAILPA